MSADIIRSSTVVTRKPHDCNFCPDPIGARRECVSAVYSVDGRAVRWWAHAECARMVMEELSECQDSDREWEAQPQRNWVPSHVAWFSTAAEARRYLFPEPNGETFFGIVFHDPDEPHDDAEVSRILRWATDGPEPGGVPVEGGGVPVPLFPHMQKSKP